MSRARRSTAMASSSWRRVVGVRVAAARRAFWLAWCCFWARGLCVGAAMLRVSSTCRARKLRKLRISWVTSWNGCADNSCADAAGMANVRIAMVSARILMNMSAFGRVFTALSIQECAGK